MKILLRTPGFGRLAILCTFFLAGLFAAGCSVAVGDPAGTTGTSGSNTDPLTAIDGAFADLKFQSSEAAYKDPLYGAKTKYFSLSRGEEVPASKKNTAEWDIAVEHISGFFYIYTNSGYTAETLGNTGGQGGVWFTNAVNFGDVVSVEDQVPVTGTEYEPYVTDKLRYQPGMSGVVPGAMNIMTYYGYESGAGSSTDDPFAMSTGAPFTHPFFEFNKKAFAYAGLTMPPTWFPTNRVYIIRHADGVSYSKFQVYDFYYTVSYTFTISFRFETLTE
jgi:hypothetical protein